ncbi:threonine-phosphate decarboxylase CobD [Colwellia sp. MSW7]|uniref:threonine-phosphate decarboxylase n=1 Tax=Colwellia maritima TaxID=2912588 RepID=A0ABS9X2R7_9GAMM|nr:threonine-phosphate decarboxylase CobD [Colwellia maritima]MCI2284082.1 threonine-phosphate decarboxylase CobD [Colwellia maritima]
MALIHGGQLQQVAKQYNIPAENWLDLSTGIAPFSYPIPSIPEKVYQSLPQTSSDLKTAAKRYYNADNLLVTNGSQAIIKLLPTLWRKKNPLSTTVYLPEQGYKEHALAWQTAGFTVYWYKNELLEQEPIENNTVLVIINPNNPTGQLYSQSTLIKYQEKLEKSNGLLVIDEAFIDVVSPSHSMSHTINSNSNTINNTLILRSFGKFFGLAGIRIGFLIGSETWIEKFNDQLGPWQVNGPAQFIAQSALSDYQWHEQQKQKLQLLSADLRTILTKSIPSEYINKITGTDLFQTVYFTESTETKSRAENYYASLCQQAVYARLTDDKQALRFGLAKKNQHERLKNALLNCY